MQLWHILSSIYVHLHNDSVKDDDDVRRSTGHTVTYLRTVLYMYIKYLPIPAFALCETTRRWKILKTLESVISLKGPIFKIFLLFSIDICHNGILTV